MEAWAVQAGNPAIDKFLTEKNWTANMCLPLLKTVLKTCSMAGGNATALIPGEGSENVPGKLKETRVMLRTTGTVNINNGGNKGGKGGVPGEAGKDKPKDGEVKPIDGINEPQKGGNQTPPPPPVTQTQTLPPPQPGHEPGKWDRNVGKWDQMTGQWNGKIWRRIRRTV
ncbi:hypothetical protein EX30DRAFT_339840 [Ascodesmis nigricans]|uniref:Uncharacterized protein n=1 Tax=Ascodesmis nigricans TaxID=341454 RepID=A0A4S2N0E6_9PEZI|nr:hypothetical protein EX30DRAFT_339840 [Ascodesmis nigricans]